MEVANRFIKNPLYLALELFSACGSFACGSPVFVIKNINSASALCEGCKPGNHLWDTRGKDIKGGSLQGKQQMGLQHICYLSPGAPLETAFESWRVQKVNAKWNFTWREEKICISLDSSNRAVGTWLRWLSLEHWQPFDPFIVKAGRKAPPEDISAHLWCESPSGEPLFHPSCWKPSAWCAVRWALASTVRMGQTDSDWKPLARKAKNNF